MNLYNYLKDEFASVEIRNKTSFKKFPNKEMWMGLEEYEELEKELGMTENESSCMLNWFMNGLAASTTFHIVDENGNFVRGKLLIIS